jgi:hypothetical protein
VTTPAIDALIARGAGGRRAGGQGVRRRRRRLPVLLWPRRTAGVARRWPPAARACSTSRSSRGAPSAWITAAADRPRRSARSPTCSRSRARTRSRSARTATPPTSSATCGRAGGGLTRPRSRAGRASARTWRAHRSSPTTGDCTPSTELLRSSPRRCSTCCAPGRRAQDRRALYHELGIAASRISRRPRAAGRIRGLKGMGAKKEALILKALESASARRPAPAGRRQPAVAALWSAGCASSARTLEFDSRSAACAAAPRPAATSTSSPSGRRPSDGRVRRPYPRVERVLGRGDTKSSVLLGRLSRPTCARGRRRAAAPRMQYFTGSKAHNIALRDRALARGWR